MGFPRSDNAAAAHFSDVLLSTQRLHCAIAESPWADAAASGGRRPRRHAGKIAV